MEKSKTLTQIWEQSEAIINRLKSRKRHSSVGKVERLASHYGCNMVDWMRSRMDPYELDEYYKVTPVPMKVYVRPLPRPYFTFNVRVYFDDGDELCTPFNAHDEKEIEDYYIGKQFTHSKETDRGFVEYKHTAVKVEITH